MHAAQRAGADAAVFLGTFFGEEKPAQILVGKVE